jgi:hypothetical protein
MKDMFELTKYMTALNVLLILPLVYIYAKNFIKMKSMFSLGLLIFGGLFLMQDLVSLYFLVTMMPYYVAGVELYTFIFTLLQTVAFIVLNLITWR